MHWDHAVIFAGGKSSRMGKDKALLPFGGYATLAEYQFRRLTPWFTRVSLSAKEDKFPFEAPIITDRYPVSSPIVALGSVLEAITSEKVFVLSVDMPKVDAELITRLYEAFTTSSEAQIAVARSPQGTEPLCAIYHRDLLPDIQTMIHHGNHRMHDLLKQSQTVEVRCDRDHLFVNLNTPEEYHLHYKGR